MDRLTRERLLLSFLLAALFHILLAIPLSMIDWQKVQESGRMKPVVLLELSDPVEEVPELPEPPVIEEPEPEPEPVTEPETISDSDSLSNPAPEPAPASTEAAPAGGATSVPRTTAPEGESSAGSASPLESPPRDTPSNPQRIVKAPESKLPPPLENPIEGKTSGNLASNDIIYADEPELDPGTRERSRDTPSIQDGSPEEVTRTLSQAELDQRLEGIGTGSEESSGQSDSAGSGTTGSADGAEGMQNGENATSNDQVKDITFSSGRSRELLRAPEIRIPPEVVSDLAGLRTIKMEISFTLEPDGTLIPFNVDSSTGSLELEDVVKNGLRSWRFSRTDDTATSQIGTIHLEILIR